MPVTTTTPVHFKVEPHAGADLKWTVLNENADKESFSDTERMDFFYLRDFSSLHDEEKETEFRRLAELTPGGREKFFQKINARRATEYPHLGRGSLHLSRLRDGSEIILPTFLFTFIPRCGHYAPTSEIGCIGDIAIVTCPVCMATLMPHSANPLHFIPTKLEKQQLYFGVELEVEAPGVVHSPKLKGIRELFAGSAILKRDGSLRDGFEICTVPMTGDRHRKLWSEVFGTPLFTESVIADDATTAGLHIHASRAPLTVAQITRYVYFMNNLENYPHITALAGREGNTFTQYRPQLTEAIIAAKLDARYSNDKYEVVNLLHPSSIEVRAFQSTKMVDRMMARLQFVDSALLYVKDKQAGDLTFRKYVDWLSGGEQRKVYTGLFDYMVALKPTVPLKVMEYLSAQVTAVRAQEDAERYRRALETEERRRYESMAGPGVVATSILDWTSPPTPTRGRRSR